MISTTISTMTPTNTPTTAPVMTQTVALYDGPRKAFIRFQSSRQRHSRGSEWVAADFNAASVFTVAI